MMITKQQAIRVATKFGMEERKGKHLFYKFIWKGIIVLTTAVPKGKGQLHCRDKFRGQLRLSEGQLEDAVACSFGLSQLIEHLQQIGKIPKEDD
jgi:hypothetical protein